MALNLMKLAVGAGRVADLARFQAARREQMAAAGLSPHPRHWTRHRPARADEVLDGGSIYWVIGGEILVRQRILGFEDGTDPEGRRRCGIVLDGTLVRTVPRRIRPFQGWRYLDSADAPPDVSGAGAAGELPESLAAELRALGLL